MSQPTAGSPPVKTNRLQRRLSRMQRKEAWEGWLFASLVLGGTLVFNIIPMLFSLVASLMEWDGISSMEYIGLRNFKDMVIKDDLFWNAFWNTLYYTGFQLPLSIAAGLGLALLVNRQLRAVNIFRTAFFSPVVTSTVAIAVVWRWIFAPYYGIFNTILGWFGIAGPNWLSDKSWALPAVILVSVWHRAGYNMVLFLAGLQGIPKTLYEAAEIDGATAWTRFWRITLPLISPTTFFLTIIGLISSFQVFGLIYVMTEGGPGYATVVYIYYLYQNAFAFFKMGYASSLAWVLFMIIGLITFVQWYLSKRWVFYR